MASEPVTATPATARIPVLREVDIITARQSGREMAGRQGFTGAELTLIATAISELARNILEHADRGTIEVTAVSDGPRRGIEIIAEDRGPGIADVDLALQDGYSTAGSLGLGLPGARRLMDEFAIRTTVGEGTVVTARKWRS